MSEAQEIIAVIKDVIGEVDLPICVAVIDNEGFELFSSSGCTHMEGAGEMNVLGIMAYESINEQVTGRTSNSVDLMIFRVGAETFFVAPVIEDLFLVANSDLTRLGHILPLLEGLRTQMAFKIDRLRKGGV